MKIFKQFNKDDQTHTLFFIIILFYCHLIRKIRLRLKTSFSRETRPRYPCSISKVCFLANV